MQHTFPRSLKHPTVIFPLLAGLAASLTLLPAILKVHVLEYDEAIFMDVARNIQRTGLPLRSLGDEGIFFFDHTPLYVYLLSLYAHASEAGILAARLVTVIVGLGCVWLTYRIGARLRNPSSGFVAALLLAINPFFAVLTFHIRMEVPLLAALLVCLDALLAPDSVSRRSRPWLAGIALAAAVLFKEVIILFVGWAAVYVLLRYRRAQRPTGPALIGLLAPGLLGLAGWAGWAWKLSPAAFAGTMNRWLNAMAAVNLLDPRAQVSAAQWAERLAFDLFGPALIVGLAVCLLIQSNRRRSPGPAQERVSLECLFLWGYLLSTIVSSFGIRLKEPRHLIGVLPVACLLIGISVDWPALRQRVWRARGGGRKLIFSVAVLLFLLSASPLRWPAGAPTDIAAWLDPLYGWRVLENDRFYNVLRLAGRYLQETTDPTDVVTVAHQATVTAYYADRRYQMLYTQRSDSIARTLERTKYLIWDDEDFQALTRAEVEALRNDIQRRFTLSAVIRDANRSVTLYR